ncbi:MAG: efflux RND transporter periplasmic adaptor subunit [Marinilabiliaceae bacterium]
MLNIIRTFTAAAVSLSLTACGGSGAQEGQAEEAPVRTSVEVTHGVAGHLERTTSFPATTRYTRKSAVTSPIDGFVAEALVTSGSVVEAGQTIFRLESKERRAVGGDSDEGVVDIKAAAEGIVLGVSLSKGDYAADGAALCAIAELNSLVFDISVPFELRRLAHAGDRCAIVLPDGERLRATVRATQATVDPASQAERLTAVTDGQTWLPEGLRATAVFNTGHGGGKAGLIVPQGVVQSDEAMASHWVLRLTADGKARKVAVRVVCRTASEIEVEADSLSTADCLIAAGGYGLEDGDEVTVTRKEGEL